MTKDEQREIENKLYEAIYPALMREERRGYNSHSRTQLICQSVIKQMTEWIERQKKNVDGS